MDPEKIIEATSQIVDKVPIYQDALQPAMKEVGVGLETVTKTILLPIRALKAVIWGVDQIEDYLDKALGEKLKNVPKQNIQEPSIAVAGPIVEAMRFHSDAPDLQDMFANLLANAMDSRTAEFGHPGYVEIIKQITSDEAKLLRFFSLYVSMQAALPLINIERKQPPPKIGKSVVSRYVSTFGIKAGCAYPHHTPTYLDNLSRLGILTIPSGMSYSNPDAYSELENLPEVIQLVNELTVENISVGSIEKLILQFTSFGEGFLRACVLPKA